MNDQPSFHTISDLPNNRHLAGLLGDLTVAWSHAERVQYFAFWVASGTSQSKAFDIYETLSGPKVRLDLTLSLFVQDKPDHPKFVSLVEKLKALIACSQLRNELVHRTWVSDTSGNLFLLNHRMTKRVPEPRPRANRRLNRPGRSRQRAPERAIHNIASMKRRRCCVGRACPSAPPARTA
jgi:hypothetical protein